MDDGYQQSVANYFKLEIQICRIAMIKSSIGICSYLSKPLWYHLTSSSIIVPQTPKIKKKLWTSKLSHLSPLETSDRNNRPMVFFWVKRQGTLLPDLLEVSYFELPELWAPARLSNFRTPRKVHRVNGLFLFFLGGAGHANSRASSKKIWGNYESYKERCWGNTFVDDGDVLDPLSKKKKDPISPQLILWNCGRTHPFLTVREILPGGSLQSGRVGFKIA